MSDTNHTKFVDFCEYCAKCKHENLPEGEDPCDECLGEPVNIDSHKPVNWEEK